MPFLNHFHPSVSLQANQLLLSQPLTGSADISLNTLVSFLDRFVYRNPKKTLQPKGASIMQPAAAGDSSGMIVNNKGARSAEGTYVNSEAFWRKKIADVPVDQVRSLIGAVNPKLTAIALLPQVLLGQARSKRCCKEAIWQSTRRRGYATGIR